MDTRDVAGHRRSVVVLSTSRGDARALRRVVDALGERADVHVLVADAAAPFWDGCDHMSAPTGLAEATSPSDLVRAGQRLAGALLDLVRAGRPDLLVLHGDRHELLPVAHAALLLELPIVHLGGGDVTEGAFDDSVRHAVTKLAHLHLCTTGRSAARIRGLGEEAWRVVVTGEPALDGLVEAAAAVGSPAELERRLGFPLREPLGLVTYHPPTATPDRLDGELAALLSASDALATVVATHPAAEPGAATILAEYQRTASARPGFHIVPHLGELYPAMLAAAGVVLGNSSSGIVEAASFGTPVVDVGDRQRGRLRPANVIHVEGERDAIAAALATAFDRCWRDGLAGLVNPYGDGQAGQRAASAIIAAPAPERLLRKRFAADTP